MASSFFSFESISIPWTVFVSILLALLVYTVYGAAWRLYLSPIAHIPGPRFAALTLWNEFYYDVVLCGRYTFKIGEYHQKYGPIVRISPHEIHINDPEYLDEIYVGPAKSKTNKYRWSVRSWGMEEKSLFDTVDHDHHRIRRAAWNPYFSKQSMYKFQGFIQTTVDKLCQRFAEHQADGRPVKLIFAYSCLTADIISEVCFPEGYNLLDAREFRTDQHDAWRNASVMQHLFKQMPWLLAFFNSFPLWLTKITAPEVYTILEMVIQLQGQAEHIVTHRDHLDTKQSTTRTSMMHHFLQETTALPDSEKTAESLAMNSMNAMAAGTMTTAHALKWATYQILSSPTIFAKLMTELETAIPDTSSIPPLQTLENLPYLRAVMWESIRLSYGASHRLQRVFPDRALVYNGYTIPPNTPVGMTSVLLHKDARIWPAPDEFNPDRWLPFETEGQRLMKYMASFSKGSRQCVGMELGKTEFLMTVASVFRRFGRCMRLDEGTRFWRDVEVYHDCFNPLPRKEGTGVVVWFDGAGN